MYVLEKRVEVINPAIFLNYPAFLTIMKIGKILNEIVGGAIVIAAIGGVAYIPSAIATIKIQDTFLHDFRGTMQVRGIELNYEGIEPYDFGYLGVGKIKTAMQKSS